MTDNDKVSGEYKWNEADFINPTKPPSNTAGPVTTTDVWTLVIFYMINTTHSHWSYAWIFVPYIIASAGYILGSLVGLWVYHRRNR